MKQVGGRRVKAGELLGQGSGSRMGARTGSRIHRPIELLVLPERGPEPTAQSSFFCCQKGVQNPPPNRASCVARKESRIHRPIKPLVLPERGRESIAQSSFSSCRRVKIRKRLMKQVGRRRLNLENYLARAQFVEASRRAQG